MVMFGAPQQTNNSTKMGHMLRRLNLMETFMED